jgi:predicted DNA-binding transcriptional regulator AlpA
MDLDLPPVLNIATVASVLGMCKQTAHKHIRNGTFPVRVITIGGRLKVLRSDLERFLDGQVAS